MTLTATWHASTRRDEPPALSPDTGEVRVPIAVYNLDIRQADIELVLSRTDAETLASQLTRNLTRRPEAVQ
jgi:hypothetical protein